MNVSLNFTYNITINLTRPWSPLISLESLTEWFIVSLIICVLGTLSYIVLFLIIFSEKSLHKGTGVLMMHLILTEALLATVHFYLFCADVFRVQTGSTSNRRYCYYSMFTYWVTLFASNWSAAFLAINRLVAVARPHFYRHLTSRTMRASMVASSWLFGLGAAAPIAAGVGGRFDSMPPLGACGIVRTRLQPQTEHVYDGVTTVGMYLPLGLTLSIYIGLFTVMKSNYGQKKLTNQVQTSADQNAGRTISRRLVMARMLFASSIWYCLCFYPIPIMMAIVPQIFAKHPMALLWLRTLLFTGFSTKPIMYYTLNAEYRDTLRKICRPVVPAASPSTPAHMSHTTVQAVQPSEATVNPAFSSVNPPHDIKL
ncbi:uncharacterized protein LOC129595835 [Paramacrobiotus metropolitanus]|uniref:uncharacterized protein LOC129595835 n=1 Tax=Paramacrobiotus metropolitanus TaxID=2943436 RepID=UPI002445B898|nr:uncharacterized protein LOC129595835 [Paramacrobiotus metropolitanus]